jgi:hypothetical protein
MLQRIAPSQFRAQTGDTIRIAAVARNNGGVEAATFRFGVSILPPTLVQGHPGCQFVVRAGSEMLGTLVVFGPAAPGARYDLFEEDPPGNLVDLQVTALPASGPLTQFQIDGVLVPAGVTAAAPARGVRASTTRRARKPAAKKAAAKRKGAKKKPTTRTPKRAVKKSSTRGGR